MEFKKLLGMTGLPIVILIVLGLFSLIPCVGFLIFFVDLLVLGWVGQKAAQSGGELKDGAIAGAFSGFVMSVVSGAITLVVSLFLLTFFEALGHMGSSGSVAAGMTSGIIGGVIGFILGIVIWTVLGAICGALGVYLSQRGAPPSASGTPPVPADESAPVAKKQQPKGRQGK